MSYRDYEDEKPEHECPTPLEDQVDNFATGGMFLSPAGRWETITDLSPYSAYSARVEVHTDRTGPDYCWQFWKSDKFPYLPSYLVSRTRYVTISETTHHIAVEVSDSPRNWGHGYSLLTASMVRGEGWKLSDCPDGKTPEHVALDNRAKARSEVNRRARAHARRLGLTVYRPEATR